MLAAATETLNYLIKLTDAAAQEGYYGVGHDKWHQEEMTGARAAI